MKETIRIIDVTPTSYRGIVEQMEDEADYILLRDEETKVETHCLIFRLKSGSDIIFHPLIPGDAPHE